MKVLKNQGEVDDGVYDWMLLNGGKGWENNPVRFIYLLPSGKSINLFRRYHTRPSAARQLNSREPHNKSPTDHKSLALCAKAQSNARPPTALWQLPILSLQTPPLRTLRFQYHLRSRVFTVKVLMELVVH